MDVIDNYVSIKNISNTTDELCNIVSKCVTVIEVIRLYSESGRTDTKTVESLQSYSLRLELLKDLAFEDLSRIPEISQAVDDVLIELAKNISNDQIMSIGEPITIMAIIGLATAVAGLAGVTAPFVAKYAPKIIESGLETNEWLKKSYLKFLCLVDKGKSGGKATSLATLIDKTTTILYGYNGSQTNGIRAIKSIGLDAAYQRALKLVQNKKLAKKIAAENAKILDVPEDESNEENTNQPTESTQPAAQPAAQSTQQASNGTKQDVVDLFKSTPESATIMAPMSRLW